MWVKKTPTEIVEVRRNRKRERVKSAAFMGIFMTVLTTFMMGWREAANRGHLLAPFGEIPKRLPVSLFFGVVSGLVYYYWFRLKPPTVVCPKCGTVGYASESSQCSCGGQQEDIEEMKWK